MTKTTKTKTRTNSTQQQRPTSFLSVSLFRAAAKRVENGSDEEGGIRGPKGRLKKKGSNGVYESAAEKEANNNTTANERVNEKTNDHAQR
jgi:hypothetical protein